MYLQSVQSVYDLTWVRGPLGNITYGDVYHQNEVEMSIFNFEYANIDYMFNSFDIYEQECQKLIEQNLPLPAYEMVLKASHTFNLLDARSAISVTERASYIGRVRTMAKLCAEGYVKQREKLGFPLLKK